MSAAARRWAVRGAQSAASLILALVLTGGLSYVAPFLYTLF